MEQMRTAIEGERERNKMLSHNIESLQKVLGDKDMEYEEQRTHMKTLHELLREKENRIEQLEIALSEGNQFRMSLDEIRDRYSELQVKFMEEESQLEKERMKNASLEEELAKTKDEKSKVWLEIESLMGKTQQQEREIELLHQLTDKHKQTERELEKYRKETEDLQAEIAKKTKMANLANILALLSDEQISPSIREEHPVSGRRTTDRAVAKDILHGKEGVCSFKQEEDEDEDEDVDDEDQYERDEEDDYTQDDDDDDDDDREDGRLYDESDGMDRDREDRMEHPVFSLTAGHLSSDDDHSSDGSEEEEKEKRIGDYGLPKIGKRDMDPEEIMREGDRALVAFDEWRNHSAKALQAHEFVSKTPIHDDGIVGPVHLSRNAATSFANSKRGLLSLLASSKKGQKPF
eukprot:TRINITY_DN578_c0_g1_i1.p2 TRINITY_DN578_c0_g1~~TRINITY_DN578_c0_g1_i1.p2  ORF type:complete len:405 (+),score=167.79 TRINITY_DN578_c0_g1_i1:426-1640(+)